MVMDIVFDPTRSKNVCKYYNGLLYSFALFEEEGESSGC